MDNCLTNTDVIITFEGMFLAKSFLQKPQQASPASLALKFIIGKEAFIYNDSKPIRDHAILTIIAKGPLANWAYHQLPLAKVLRIQTTSQNGSFTQLLLLKVIIDHAKSPATTNQPNAVQPKKFENLNKIRASKRIA